MAGVPLFPRIKRQARGKLPLYYFLYFFQDGRHYILFKLRSRARYYFKTVTNVMIDLDFASIMYARIFTWFLILRFKVPSQVEVTLTLALSELSKQTNAFRTAETVQTINIKYCDIFHQNNRCAVKAKGVH